MKFWVILAFFLFTAPSLSFATMSGFTRTLYAGMRGEDVREIQKVLNLDAETRIATVGPGSPGNETDYFGLATKHALVKFQEKYREEVLAPLGLASGTGVFGEKTRAKAQMLLLVTPTIPKSMSATATTGTPIQKGEVFVYFPSQYSGKHGATITLSGSGFTATDNTVYFDSIPAVGKVPSWNGQMITFKIPVIPKGIYHLFIKNARGESNKDMFFVVTDGVTPEPKIESVTPGHATRGGAVTIKGSGFTSTGNMVRSSVSVSGNVSPSKDGGVLSFAIPADILIAIRPPSAPKVSLPIWVYVVNENGVSNGKSFVLDF